MRIFEGKPKDHACSCSPRTSCGSTPARPGTTRRSFLRTSAGVTGGMVALAAALSPLRDWDSEDRLSIDAFLQKHYKEMTPEEMEEALVRIRASVKRRYDVDASVDAPPPLEGVEFVYALNLSRCNGNRRCVHACVEENNQSRSPELQYIRVIEMPHGTTDLEKGNHHYEGDSVPREGFYYLPVQCHQCADPPCVKVCPVEATWQEADGITVIDYDWCIGCRYCEAACPYWARRFNYVKPEYATNDDGSTRLNPEMSYLSNRPRPKGVVEKCTFCLQRTRKGKNPACLEACPTGARKFGNVLDPDSEVSNILRTKNVFVLKEEVGTIPRFFYYYDDRTPGQRDPEGGA